MNYQKKIYELEKEARDRGWPDYISTGWTSILTGTQHLFLIIQGTIFEPEEIEKKKVSYSNQIARDHKNHKRFTGAFTGGFSAGYFNTVGSKEGWKPAQFVSTKGTLGTC